MDASEALCENDFAAKVSWLQCCVLTSRTFAVVVLGYNKPRLILRFPLLCQLWNRGSGAIFIICDVSLAGCSVDGTNQSVLGNVG